MHDKKAEMIGRLHGYRLEDSGRDLTMLLDILVAETRESNDRAEGIQVSRNQGKIEGFLELRDMIARGLPGLE